MRAMTIGALSKASGVKVPTIRFYEGIGLLPTPPRTESNRRTYEDRDVQRLRFIRHARDLGFELDHVRELLVMTAEPQASCHRADSIARQHLGEVDRRLTQLTALKGELQRMVDECLHGRVCDCRVIEVLGDHDRCQHEHR